MHGSEESQCHRNIRIRIAIAHHRIVASWWPPTRRRSTLRVRPSEPSATPSSLTPLPIDPLLPEIVAHLRSHGCLVLEAPPGAGKTTRVPRALDDAGFIDGEILVLEPRRLEHQDLPVDEP